MDSDRDFVNAAPVRCHAQETLGWMNLQVKHGRIGKAVLKELPVRSAVGRMPDPDISTDVNVVRRPPIDRERVVLDIKQVRRRRTAAGVPILPVVPPDP
jgi:hypothetical protein